MRRAPMKPSTKPMARSGFKTRYSASNAATVPVKPRKRMKSSRPKMTPMRMAARDQECTIRLPEVCNYDPSTSVLCHDNRLASGKGMGLKAPDTAAAIGCSSCHDVLDGRRPRPLGMTLEFVYACFDAAVQQTHRIFRRAGITITES